MVELLKQPMLIRTTVFVLTLLLVTVQNESKNTTKPSELREEGMSADKLRMDNNSKLKNEIQDLESKLKSNPQTYENLLYKAAKTCGISNQITKGLDYAKKFLDKSKDSEKRREIQRLIDEFNKKIGTDKTAGKKDVQADQDLNAIDKSLSECEPNLSDFDRRKVRKERLLKLSQLYVECAVSSDEGASKLDYLRKSADNAEKLLREFPEVENALDIQMLKANCLRQCAIDRKSNEAAEKAYREVILFAQGDKANKDRFIIAVKAAKARAEILIEAGKIVDAKNVFTETVILNESHDHALIKYFDDMKNSYARIGEPAPTINENDFFNNNKPIDISKFKDKVILIHFWKTSSEICKDELDRIVKLRKEYEDKIVIIGVCLDRQDKKDDLNAIKSEKRIDWPQAYNGQSWNDKTAIDYKISVVPESYLLDRNRNIIGVGLHGLALERAVNRAVIVDEKASGTKGK